MDEINNNLKKLKGEVTQINNIFQKDTMNNSNDYEYYISLLDVLVVRFIILLFFFYGLIYFTDPDFCYDEIVNEQTYFKEKKYNIKYVIFATLMASVIIFYITHKMKILKK
jgi:hypothetical protein